MHIATKNDMIEIEQYVKDTDICKEETKEAITELILVLIGLGLPLSKAFNNTDSIIIAMRNEWLYMSNK